MKSFSFKGSSINSFAMGKSSEIDASRGELLSDIRDYEGRDAGETLAKIASPKGDLQDASREIREKGQRRIGAIAADLPVKELLEVPLR